MERVTIQPDQVGGTPRTVENNNDESCEDTSPIHLARDDTVAHLTFYDEGLGLDALAPLMVGGRGDVEPAPDVISVDGGSNSGESWTEEAAPILPLQEGRRGCKWHFCKTGGCSYKAKESCGVKKHKQNVHNIDVVWHFCKIGGCDYKAKLAGDLKKHKQRVHNIDVVWHFCKIGDCSYKAKQAGKVKRHKQDVHKHQSTA